MTSELVWWLIGLQIALGLFDTVFHHELTDGVASTVKRDFWMATKHHHAVRIHRDTDSFTATDGPLIQGVGVIGSAPTAPPNSAIPLRPSGFWPATAGCRK